MKKMWNMLRALSRRDDRGISFVEMLCAVAILSLVAGVIGTVVVVSTRTYNRGISETNIQQEAQLAANNIGNMVKDACSVVYGESGQQYLENGEDLMSNPDSSPKMQADGFTELSIVTNEDIQYTMTYDEGNSMLMYQEFGSDGSALTGTEIMANNIVAFTADTTDFKNSKTIKLNMTVEDKSTSRKIPMEYTMTSRNDAVEGAVYVSHADSVALMFQDSDVVLVPGETYRIPLVVAGNLTEGIDWVSWGALETVSLTLDYAEVKVPVGTTSTSETITVRTKDKDEDGNYKATASCDVLIRRVDSVQVTHSVDTTNSTGGMYETTGTVYTFTASVSGNELAKHVAYAYDENYKTAQAATWSYVLKINGADQTAQFGDYFEVLSTKEDTLVPSFAIKVKKTMPAGLELTVRATSKHASGMNKANSDYYDGLGIDPVNIYYGEDTLEPRETKVNQGLEIILEPYETGEVKLNMKGGLSSDVTFAYNGATDSATFATYDEATDTVKITLGKDEKGSGKTDSSPHKCIYTKSDQEVAMSYMFTIDVLVSGEVKTTIIVHVCRIDEISIEIPKDVWHDDKGNKMNFPTYDFRARFNVDNGSKADMDKVVNNLIQYKADGTLDEAAVKRTLSSKITWELIDHNSDFKFKDSVICMAGTSASDKGEIKGTYTKNYKRNGEEFYNVISVKPARVEQDANGNWFIKQLPEIDISLSKKDTTTGLPKGYELKVTIEALHPGGMNKADTLYKEGVEASISIFGEMTIETPTQLVIVEPGQGINETEMSEREMVVPISVSGGEVYSMTATISENSDSNTKLSSYPKSNPYSGGKTTSANNKSTWYLGLLIGEKEKGNHEGRIKVHLVGYNTNKEEVATYDFELGVRRVDKIDVKVAGGKNINTVNEANTTITLEALPNGCDNKTTAFYNIQKDEKNNVCRWEQKGHGEYKDPYVMEWRMFYNGEEQPLSKWTDYIDTAEDVKPKTSTDPDNDKATVTFKLTQPLPNGAKIRAYSLHALGKVGDTEYNKSGKKYNEVYGEITINGSYVVADGFQRADDYDFVSASPFPNIRSLFSQSIYNSKQRTFFRYKEVGTDWNSDNKQYHMMDGEDEFKAPFSGDLGARLFLPNKEYELEIVNVVYGTGPQGQKVIYWPQDTNLLEAGRGWAEEGYTLWDGTWGHTEWGVVGKNEWGGDEWGNVDKYKEIYEQVKNTPQEAHNYLIPKSKIYFDKVDGVTESIDGKIQTIGSESQPRNLKNVTGTSSNGERHFAVQLAPTSFNIQKTQAHFTAKIDKWENNSWVLMEALTQSNSLNENTYHWFMQVSVPKYDIYHIWPDASGKYRIRATVTGMTWTKITGGLFDTGSDRYKKYEVDNIDLFDMSDESGVMYIKLN